VAHYKFIFVLLALHDKEAKKKIEKNRKKLKHKRWNTRIQTMVMNKRKETNTNYPTSSFCITDYHNLFILCPNSKLKNIEGRLPFVGLSRGSMCPLAPLPPGSANGTCWHKKNMAISNHASGAYMTLSSRLRPL